MICSGGTGSGKTEWVMRFLRSLGKLVEPRIRCVFYCYGESNRNVLKLAKAENAGYLIRGAAAAAAAEAMAQNENGEIMLTSDTSNARIKTLNGVPSETILRAEATRCQGRLLLILDDLLPNLRASYLDPLFTRTSHNLGISVVLITQHLFAKELRVARSNAHYLVMMRNPAGELQSRTIATQLFPLRTRYFLEAYNDATESPFSYLIVDSIRKLMIGCGFEREFSPMTIPAYKLSMCRRMKFDKHALNLLTSNLVKKFAHIDCQLINE